MENVKKKTKQKKNVQKTRKPKEKWADVMNLLKKTKKKNPNDRRQLSKSRL